MPEIGPDGPMYLKKNLIWLQSSGHSFYIYCRVQCFCGSSDFVHACISVCVSACAIISMCIRVLVNKERLKQMLAVKVSQLSANQLIVQNKHHNMFIYHDFIRVDFSAI